uniref:Uncharacterized protein n=1 Tax=Solanum lycopersicum TaxID=4081 RepID=A0A3Q7JFJ4_SOLLC
MANSLHRSKAGKRGPEKLTGQKEMNGASINPIYAVAPPQLRRSHSPSPSSPQPTAQIRSSSFEAKLSLYRRLK